MGKRIRRASVTMLAALKLGGGGNSGDGDRSPKKKESVAKRVRRASVTLVASLGLSGDAQNAAEG